MRRPEHEPSIQHFSHPHPLLLINPQNLTITTQCSGCELQPSGWMYTCTPCNFTLHLSCAQMPQLINHPSHPSHPLTLLPTPPYPSRAFICNDCRGLGSGFCFHCNHCSFDLHILCATRPVSSMTHMYAHRPAGPNNFVHSQSMGMYQNSQVGRPGATNGNSYLGVVAQGFVAGAAIQAGQYFMQGIVGDGSGGGDGGGGDPGGDNAGDSSMMGLGLRF